ncbi:MAG: LysR family transcriptional regulator [Halieaceae bacterium]|jgi:LysR family transcriptional activator of nhaA|nr:LysR family transcriptional regulator [Halieaceae bacterium]
MRLNYNHLRYFWAVAHNGNLTRTAEQLHVSQSALSLQIKKLEEQLGHELFERRGKQLILTEAGRLALDHADVIFASGTELLNTLSGEGTSREILRVGALATLSRNFQIAFLNPLVGREQTEVVVRSGNLADLLAQLEAHRLDVVLTNTAPPRDAATPWIVRHLDSQPVSLVGYPEKRRKGRSLEDALREEPLVLPTLETAVRTAFDTYCDEHGIRPNIVAEVDDMALLRVLARSNYGAAVTPAIVVRDELASGQLVEIANFPGVEEQFQAITLSRQFPNRLLKLLFDAMDDD